MLVERVRSEAALAQTPGLVLVALEGKAAEQGGWEVGAGRVWVGSGSPGARSPPAPLCPGEPRALPCLLSRGRGSPSCRCSQLVLSPLSKMRRH